MTTLYRLYIEMSYAIGKPLIYSEKRGCAFIGSAPLIENFKSLQPINIYVIGCQAISFIY